MNKSRRKFKTVCVMNMIVAAKEIKVLYTPNVSRLSEAYCNLQTLTKIWIFMGVSGKNFNIQGLRNKVLHFFLKTRGLQHRKSPKLGEN